ncbi:hypothetical protein CQY20_18805 [Mycolicibacterium agri]|uniref:DUF5642 domain-containing protein n=1 Tax=Mycolicibacterium agri TaxID=36811 RepID=A0A2A7MXC0_MYCAG|nr:hypothetical protein [Mycolicibacterium agri]PEG36472.1 hypothetical protein CQY20_18805 [Mycolicibacterium agri]GFG49542.1 hypothetical protein MAGR_09830 [Mycolicibacterium agri]
MISTVRKDPRGIWLSAVLVVTATALVGGCTRVVTGTGRAAESAPTPAAPVRVADLLIEPSQFPPQYPAAVLDPRDTDRVVAEIDGVAGGSDVTPPECAPLPVLAPQKAAVQGVDDNGARLTVTVIRPVPSLRARISQLEECPSVTVTGDDDSSQKVTVKLTPPPPVDADDAYAVDQTASKPAGGAARMLTLVALVGDVRVTASWQGEDTSGAEPDAATDALDTLFSDAVLKVRRFVPR